MIQCKFCQRTFDAAERLHECPGCGAPLPRRAKPVTTRTYVPTTRHNPDPALKFFYDPWFESPQADETPARWSRFAIGWTVAMCLLVLANMASRRYGMFGLYLSLLVCCAVWTQRKVYRSKGIVNLISLTHKWEAGISFFCFIVGLTGFFSLIYETLPFLPLTAACYIPAWRRLQTHQDE